MLVDRSDGHFYHEGVCPICDSNVGFKAHGLPLRSSFICLSCASSPRERAIIAVLTQFYPNWRDLRIHESSPGPMNSSKKMREECKDYVASEYDPDVPFGTIHEKYGYRSEDLENQTFPDESFDLVITQDVFEHLFRPDLAIREIRRTLRLGGAHICTVPIVRRELPSVRRARRDNGRIEHILGPMYHRNPVKEDEGSLVTIDWGFDIAVYFTVHGLATTIVQIDDLERGIRADYLEVLVCRKLEMPEI